MMQRLVGLALIGLLVGTAQAENWPSWRGADNSGVARGTGFPTEWSLTKNMAWKIDLPGRGSSTPVVWDGHILLTCVVDGKNIVLDYDWKGQERWRAEVKDAKPGKHQKASGSNSSCVTDGEHIFAYFKSGDLACLNFAGKVLWHTNLQERYGPDTLWWDLGTSPVLTKTDCVVAVIQSDSSYLVAFDKVTGKEHWKVDRNLDAPEEAQQSYTSPVVIQDQGRELLIVLGADHVTAHEATTGQEVWRVGGLNPTRHKYFRSIASPAVHQGYVLAPYARGETVTGIKLGGSGDVTKTHVVWTKTGNGPDVPTPAVAGGKGYILSDRGVLTCVDVATGKEVWSGQVEKHRLNFSASPVLADGKIYLTREDGKTFVLAQGNEFKLLATNDLDETQTVATPVFLDGKILIRTDTRLFCIGK